MFPNQVINSNCMFVPIESLKSNICGFIKKGYGFVFRIVSILSFSVVLLVWVFLSGIIQIRVVYVTILARGPPIVDNYLKLSKTMIYAL